MYVLLEFLIALKQGLFIFLLDQNPTFSTKMDHGHHPHAQALPITGPLSALVGWKKRNDFAEIGQYLSQPDLSSPADPFGKVVSEIFDHENFSHRLPPTVRRTHNDHAVGFDGFTALHWVVYYRAPMAVVLRILELAREGGREESLLLRTDDRGR